MELAARAAPITIWGTGRGTQSGLGRRMIWRDSASDPHTSLHERYKTRALRGIVTTTSDESIEMAKRLSKEERLFCGISSGCNVAAEIKIASAIQNIEPSWQ